MPFLSPDCGTPSLVSFECMALFFHELFVVTDIYAHISIQLNMKTTCPVCTMLFVYFRDHLLLDNQSVLLPGKTVFLTLWLLACASLYRIETSWTFPNHSSTHLYCLCPCSACLGSHVGQTMGIASDMNRKQGINSNSLILQVLHLCIPFAMILEP